MNIHSFVSTVSDLCSRCMMVKWRLANVLFLFLRKNGCLLDGAGEGFNALLQLEIYKIDIHTS